MKKYKLEDLDLSEKGYTHCHECPLNDENETCSKSFGGVNIHLGNLFSCSCFKVKLRKTSKNSNLALYYKHLALFTGVIALGLMLKLFITMQQTSAEGGMQLVLMCCSTLSLIISLFGKKLDKIGK